MTDSDVAPRQDARLIEDARNWLPTDDAEARRSIVGLLAMTAQVGVDPIAALREALHRWFGAAAADLLRPPTVAEPATPLAPGFVAFEPLPPLRRPTLWPQRPKRFVDELFSSWLWRASAAAGAPPDRFAADAFRACFVDPDTEVSEATLRRLALLSGQPAFPLAAGTLTVTEPITRADVLLDALLRHGGFLLSSAPCAGRLRPVLQYCPRCLATDPRPYFRRRWRFATEAVCVQHRCRLHDACWRCDASVELLGRSIASPQPVCASCEAILSHATAAPASDAAQGQRGLTCVLYYAAVCLEPEALRAHLGTLAREFPSGNRVVERERAIAHFRPTNLDRWFGPVTDPDHRDLMRQHAGGKVYGAWFGSAGVRTTAAIPDVPPLGRSRPLSRCKRPRGPWFTARPPRPVRPADPREDGRCPPPA